MKPITILYHKLEDLQYILFFSEKKLDSVNKFLKKKVSFTNDVEAVDTTSDKDREEDVNYVSSVGFQNQRSGNQNGNRNCNGNGQMSNYNKSSQYQKPFCSNRNYVASSYKNPAPAT